VCIVNGDSTIDEGDYGIWTARFGQTFPPGSGAAELSAEPALSFARTGQSEVSPSTLRSISESQTEQYGRTRNFHFTRF
jgi:hypothetical protein